ncbi:hypothetical protein EI94DRAFT_1698638 [Lactarius quietus]|nr:hypothetical protein EI94DRAFT_1698638 [Lactarius quietus]
MLVAIVCKSGNLIQSVVGATVTGMGENHSTYAKCSGAVSGVVKTFWMTLPESSVFACDISTAKFPRADKPEANKMTFFQHDVTEPLPDEIRGTFELVNTIYLGFALTAQGSPGGYLVLRDGDPLMYTHENPPPLEGHKADIMEYAQGLRPSHIGNDEAMKAGCLELGDGTRIDDEDERHTLMKDLRHHV